MRVLVTGSNGLFGQTLVRQFSSGDQVIPMTRHDADLRDAERTRAFVRAGNPELIIHTAAIRDIDACDRDPEQAWAVNFQATRTLSETAQQLGAAFAFISTDAVFNNASDAPANEDAAPAPATVYAQTKYEAERVVLRAENSFVFRVPLLFGPNDAPNFIDNAIDKAARGEAHRLASDQTGSALFTCDGAKMLETVVSRREYGLVHLANEGKGSRYEFALRAAELAGVDFTSLIPALRESLGGRALRSRYMVLGTSRLEAMGVHPRSWQDALAEYVPMWRSKRVAHDSRG